MKKALFDEKDLIHWPVCGLDGLEGREVVVKWYELTVLRPGPEVIKLFLCSTQLSMKF